MAFRQSATDTEYARLWRAFVRRNAVLLDAAQIPEALRASRRAFDHFLMHGVDLPTLAPARGAALAQLAVRYMAAGFPDPGFDTTIRLLAALVRPGVVAGVPVAVDAQGRSLRLMIEDTGGDCLLLGEFLDGGGWDHWFLTQADAEEIAQERFGVRREDWLRFG